VYPVVQGCSAANLIQMARLSINPDRKDDGGDAIPLETPLNGVGSLILTLLIDQYRCLHPLRRHGKR